MSTTETKVRHTPGPWTAVHAPTADDVESLYEIRDEHDSVIAILPDSTAPKMDAADAHLIAAAPDMLEALERVSVIAEREKWFEFAFGSQKATAWGFLQKAIAKSRGGAA